MAGFNLVLTQIDPKAAQAAAAQGPAALAAFQAAQIQRSNALTAAMNAVQTQSAGQLAGVKAPPATTANPSAGRTILGLPMVDVVVGAVVAAGLAVVARVKGWF